VNLLNSKKKVAAAGIIAATLVSGGAIAASAADGTGCRTLMYPLCERSVASAQVVDSSLTQKDLALAVRSS
jgi:hypothetical protein